MSSCPTCLSRSTQAFARSVHNEPLQICTACRHVYFPTQPTEMELNEYYLSSYTESHGQLQLQLDNRDYYKNHSREIEQRLRDASLPLSFIDYGSSYPVLSEEALKLGFATAIAVDVSTAVRAYAIDHGVSMVAPDRTSTLPTGAYSLVRFSHVVEHLHNPVEVLREAHRLLQPGGLVYITQPSFPICKVEETEVVYSNSVYPEHLHFFNPWSLTQLLSLSGFEVAEYLVFQKEAEMANTFAGIVDLQFDAGGYGALKGRVSKFTEPLARPPYGFGENIALWARKLG